MPPGLGTLIGGNSESDFDPDGAVEFAIRSAMCDGLHVSESDPTLLLRIAGNDPLALLRAVPTAALWQHVREELITRPKWCAEQSAIEQLAYLSDVKPKVPLPSIYFLEELWESKARCDKEQIKKVLRAWRDFVRTTEIETLEEITPEMTVAFADDVNERRKPDGTEFSGKQQQHIFNGIRQVVTNAIKRAVCVDDLGKILVYLKLMVPEKVAKSADPKPIEPEDWKALEATATGEDRAMIFLMLNCALYLKETVRLINDDFKKNCLLTKRLKTGQCIRAATLWPETIEAMKVLPQGPKDILFLSYQKVPIKICGAQRRFAALAKAAGVPHVTASMLRDGAATAAIENNVHTNLSNLHLGHSCGMSDHYVKRNPKMVQPATDAVRRCYFS